MTEPICRCSWAQNPTWSRYHDEEWGRPVHDDRQLFEMLLLEGQAAGLSFPLMLRKRAGMREAYDGFDPHRLAAYDEERCAALLQDERVIRNRLKIRAAVENARAYFQVVKRFGSLDRFLWSYVEGRPIRNIWDTAGPLPTRSARSDRLSRDMKALGFRFVGSVTLFSYMEAVGMYNDHQKGCFLYHLGEEEGALAEEMPYPGKQAGAYCASASAPTE